MEDGIGQEGHIVDCLGEVAVHGLSRRVGPGADQLEAVVEKTLLDQERVGQEGRVSQGDLFYLLVLELLLVAYVLLLSHRFHLVLQQTGQTHRHTEHHHVYLGTHGHLHLQGERRGVVVPRAFTVQSHFHQGLSRTL